MKLTLLAPLDTADLYSRGLGLPPSNGPYADHSGRAI
jgi:hypothetical protein